MSRFNNYLNESLKQELDVVLNKIEDKCSHYLNEVRKRNYWLYSGRRNDSDLLIHKKVRKDRRPKDTPLDLHFYLDELFRMKTGIKLRSNSVFGIRSYDIARKYGTVYVLFPIGNNYSLWYNPDVNDLWSEVSWIHKEQRSLDDEDIQKFLKDLVNGYKRGFTKYMQETMLHCDNYMGLNLQWVQNHWLEDHVMDWMEK